MTTADEKSIARARAFVDRRHINNAIEEGAPLDSEAGQYNALYKACDNALQEVADKRQELLDSGNFTPQGVCKALKPEVERINKELEKLEAEVLGPRLKKLDEKASAIREQLVVEPTEADEALAMRFTQAPREKQQTLLARALKGDDMRLARALATVHPLMADISEINRAKLLSHLNTPDATQKQVLERTKRAKNLAAHLRQTRSKIVESV